MNAISETMTSLDEHYFDRVRAFPLRTIRDDDDLDRAIAVVDELLDEPELSLGEQEYLDVLGTLIEDYESEHIPIPEVSGVDMLRHLMEENSLTQRDITPLFGDHPSIVSEVLNGKRKLAKNHVLRLSEYFGLPTDVFLRP